MTLLKLNVVVVIGIFILTTAEKFVMKRPRSGGSIPPSHENKTKRQTPSTVEVVTCAAAFPISHQKRTKYNPTHHGTDNATHTDAPRNGNTKKSTTTTQLLDWNETVREVQKFGAQGWGAATIRSKKYGNRATLNDNDADDATTTKHSIANPILERKLFRQHQKEQYELLTGRTKKQHAVPLPIVRGIRKKAVAREARIRQEAQDAGIVLPLHGSGINTLPSAQQKERMKKQ